MTGMAQVVDAPRRTLLVLGAGRGQVGLIRAGQRLGHRVVVASLPSTTAPGLRVADEVVWADISSPAAVLAAARECRADAVATSCADTGLLALGRVCDATGLNGISEAVAVLCSDKGAMKEAFERGHVRTAAYKMVSTAEEAHEAAQTLGMPVVVKATDLQGSKGVIIVREEGMLDETFAMVSALTKQPHVIVEEFLAGEEFGAQAMVVDGEVLFVSVHDDAVLTGATSIPIGHFIPSSLPAEVRAQAEEEVRRAIQAVGLDNCAVNVDLMLRDTGEVFIIELTGRVGANGLPEMMSAHLGTDYYEVIVNVAMGTPNDVERLRGAVDSGAAAAVVMVARPEAQGTLEAITLPDPLPSGAGVQLFVETGAVLEGFRHSGDCLGQVLAQGADRDRVEELARSVEQQIAVVVH